jgi:transposase
MQVIHARCAGLDVHKKMVVACLRIMEGGQVTKQIKTFKTTTAGLLELKDFLTDGKCTHAVLEATGVYWKPVWHVLTDDIELLLANPQHVKTVPGRKSDVNDATWLAELLAHGLIRSSFVPPPPIQALRDLTRTRKQLVREQGQHVLRIHKVLEDANIKVASVLTDMMGVSGRAVLADLIQGQSDPEKLVLRVAKNVKASRQELLEALRGHPTKQHRLLLRVHLGQVDALDRAIEQLESEITELLRPFRQSYELLLTIPGVKQTVAQIIVAEVGVDMSRFPTAEHLISWAGLCPQMDESAGKKRNTRLRKGAPWLKTALVQAAWAAARTKNTYLRAQFLRLKGHLPLKKALVAVAASILKAVYYMLRDGVVYKDLGGDYFDRRQPVKKLHRLIRQIENLGLQVQLDPNASNVLRVAA